MSTLKNRTCRSTERATRKRPCTTLGRWLPLRTNVAGTAVLSRADSVTATRRWPRTLAVVTGGVWSGAAARKRWPPATAAGRTGHLDRQRLVRRPESRRGLNDTVDD